MKFFFITIIFFCSQSIAHHKIYSPRVEEGRRSLEWRGHFDVDDDEENNKSYHHVFETEYSWTHFWQSELEFHVSDKSDTPLDWEKTELQNQVQILNFEFFASALYFSYNFVSEGKEADEIEYKYLNEFNTDKFSFITNFIFEKQVGSTAEGSTTFDLSNSLMFKDIVVEDFDLGVFGFSGFGEISNFSVFGLQKHQYGFLIEKELRITDYEVEVALGLLHGFTDASADKSIIWNLEFEF